MSQTPIRSVGRYELLEVIGRGGAAVVYLADQSYLRRRVALKELAPLQAVADPTFAGRFAEESRVAGSLSHPNIESRSIVRSTAISSPRTCSSRPTAGSRSPTSEWRGPMPTRRRGRW